MQNPIQKFRQTKLYCFRETRYFDELQLPYSPIFLAETWHTSPTYQCLQKGVWDFFKFCLDLELLIKV